MKKSFLILALVLAALAAGSVGCVTRTVYVRDADGYQAAPETPQPQPIVRQPERVEFFETVTRRTEHRIRLGAQPVNPRTPEQIRVMMEKDPTLFLMAVDREVYTTTRQRDGKWVEGFVPPGTAFFTRKAGRGPGWTDYQVQEIADCGNPAEGRFRKYDAVGEIPPPPPRPPVAAAPAPPVYVEPVAAYGAIGVTGGFWCGGGSYYNSRVNIKESYSYNVYAPTDNRWSGNTRVFAPTNTRVYPPVNQQSWSNQQCQPPQPPQPNPYCPPGMPAGGGGRSSSGYYYSNAGRGGYGPPGAGANPYNPPGMAAGGSGRGGYGPPGGAAGGGSYGPPGARTNYGPGAAGGGAYGPPGARGR